MISFSSYSLSSLLPFQPCNHFCYKTSVWVWAQALSTLLVTGEALDPKGFMSNYLPNWTIVEVLKSGRYFFARSADPLRYTQITDGKLHKSWTFELFVKCGKIQHTPRESPMHLTNCFLMFYFSSLWSVGGQETPSSPAFKSTWFFSGIWEEFMGYFI